MNTVIALFTVIVMIGTVSKVRCQGTGVAAANCTVSNGSACKAIAHAECAGQAPTCKCQQGYESTTDTTKCTAIALNGVCNNKDDCKLLPNTVCDTTCKCADGYKEDSSACKLVFGSQCSGTAPCLGLGNSLCANDKCGCATGFAVKNNLCVAESGAVKVKSAVGLVFGSLIMLLVQAL